MAFELPGLEAWLPLSPALRPLGVQEKLGPLLFEVPALYFHFKFLLIDFLKILTTVIVTFFGVKFHEF